MESPNIPPIQSAPLLSPIPEPKQGGKLLKIFLIGACAPLIVMVLGFIPGLNLVARIISPIIFFPISVGLAFHQYWLVTGFISLLPSFAGLVVAGIVDGIGMLFLATIYLHVNKRVFWACMVVIGIALAGWQTRDAWVPVTLGRWIPSTCNSLTGEGLRDTCFQNAAYARNDFYLCTRVSYNPYPCIQHFINTQTPNDACMMFPRGSNGGDNCTILLAKTKSNAAICDQINGNAKNSCLEGAQHPTSVTDCETLFTGASERVRCVWNLAENTKNPALCDYSQPGYDAHSPEEQQFGHWLNVCLYSASPTMNGKFGYGCEEAPLSPLNHFVCVLTFAKSSRNQDVCSHLTDKDQADQCRTYALQ